MTIAPASTRSVGASAACLAAARSGQAAPAAGRTPSPPRRRRPRPARVHRPLVDPAGRASSRSRVCIRVSWVWRRSHNAGDLLAPKVHAVAVGPDRRRGQSRRARCVPGVPAASARGPPARARSPSGLPSTTACQRPPVHAPEVVDQVGHRPARAVRHGGRPGRLLAEGAEVAGASARSWCSSRRHHPVGRRLLLTPPRRLRDAALRRGVVGLAGVVLGDLGVADVGDEHRGQRLARAPLDLDELEPGDAEVAVLAVAVRREVAGPRASAPTSSSASTRPSRVRSSPAACSACTNV